MPTEEQMFQKKKLKKILICVLVPLVLFGGLLFIYYKALIPVDVRRFDAAYITELETEYNMDLSGVTPQRHWQVSIAPDSHDLFRFTVDDPVDFMETCFFGEIVTEYADETEAQYKCVPYPDEQGDSSKRFAFIILFRRDGETYQAELRSYYETVSRNTNSALFSDVSFPYE